MGPKGIGFFEASGSTGASLEESTASPELLSSLAGPQSPSASRPRASLCAPDRPCSSAMLRGSRLSRLASGLLINRRRRVFLRIQRNECLREAADNGATGASAGLSASAVERTRQERRVRQTRRAGRWQWIGRWQRNRQAQRAEPAPHTSHRLQDQSSWRLGIRTVTSWRTGQSRCRWNRAGPSTRRTQWGSPERPCRSRTRRHDAAHRWGAGRRKRPNDARQSGRTTAPWRSSTTGSWPSKWRFPQTQVR